MSPKNSAEQFYLASAGEMSELEHEEWAERKKKYDAFCARAQTKWKNMF